MLTSGVTKYILVLTNAKGDLFMLSQISKWGNSQGIRISKKTLKHAGMNLNDEVEIESQNNIIIIKAANKKTLSWYLDSYDEELDRYDWGDSDKAKDRELL